MHFRTGMRLVALHDETDEHVEIIGSGQYIGKMVPDESSSSSEQLRELDIPDNTIELDDGCLVYECECYFLPEEELEDYLGGRDRVYIDIDQIRRDYHEAVDDSEG